MSSSSSSCGLFATMSTLSLLTCPCHLEKAESKGSKVKDTFNIPFKSSAWALAHSSPLIDSRCYRSSAGLLPDWWLLPKPLPGGAADERSGWGSAGVPRDPSDRRPGAQGADDQTHVWRPLRCQSEWDLLNSLLLTNQTVNQRHVSPLGSFFTISQRPFTFGKDLGFKPDIIM